MDGQSNIEIFGYKMAWLAIKNATPEEIIRKINLPETQPVEWNDGVRKINDLYDNNTIFITPQINGWTLLVGRYFSDLNSRDGKIEKLKTRVMELSSVFDEVQALANHRVADYCHWMLARGGKMVRCFVYSGGEGVMKNDGEATEAEREFPWDKLKSLGWSPKEENVMMVAENWSINPLAIKNSNIEGKMSYIANVSQ